MQGLAGQVECLDASAGVDLHVDGAVGGGGVATHLPHRKLRLVGISPELGDLIADVRCPYCVVGHRIVPHLRRVSAVQSFVADCPPSVASGAQR